MKILVVGPQWVGRWTESTHRALSDMGHSVRSFYYTDIRVEKVTLGLARRLTRAAPWLAARLARYGERWQQEMNRRLVALSRASRPDLILILKGETVLPETIASLREAAGHLATWWVDDPLRHTLAREAMPSYDAVFVFDRSYLAPLAQAGAAEVHFLPCCCDTSVFKPTTLSPSTRDRYGCDIAFVAVYYPARGLMVKHFAGLKVRIWGPQWDGADAQRALASIGKDSWRGKFVDQATSVRIYNASKICLNVHHTQTSIGGLNTRTFEVPACGAFLLTDYVTGMEELITPGEEVACYTSRDEIRPLVEHYLAHPDERVRLSERGRARVLSEHTYHHRMQTMLRALRLSD